MNYWVIIYRFAWGILIVLFVIGLTCIFLPKCNSLRELQRKQRSLEEENRRTAAHVRELRRKRERFRSEASFVERTARENGMVKPGEVVFKFTNGNARAAWNTSE